MGPISILLLVVWASAATAWGQDSGPGGVEETDHSGPPVADPSDLDAIAQSGGAWTAFGLAYLVGACAVIVARGWWRPGRGPIRRRGPAALGVAMVLAALMVWLATQITAAIAAGVASGLAPGLAGSATGGLWMMSVALGGMYAGCVLAVWALVASRTGVVDADLGWRGRRDLVAGVVGIVVAFPLVQLTHVGATLVAQLVSGEWPDPIAHETLQDLVDQRMTAAALVVAVLVSTLTPLLEEVIYRGLLQTGVREITGSRWTAILVASTLFTAAHLGSVGDANHALAGLFTLSIALGILRERTGSIIAPTIAHGVFNAYNVVVAMALTA